MIYQIIPISIYHAYMYVHTDNLIPTSIKSRLERTAQSDYIRDFTSTILNNYAFSTRYPDDFSPISEEEYRNAVKIAENVYIWVL